MNYINTDIAIIGGGASGLVCAYSASLHTDKKITIIEKLQRVGKKILSTGNGRCNLSNNNKSVEKYIGDNRFLDYTADYIGTKALFNELGVAIKSDETGRIYPYSMTASSVLDALRFAVESRGVNVICDTKAEEINKTKNGYEIICNNTRIYAGVVIISTGGCSSPSLGSTGDGYTILKRLGHTVTELHPALSPIRTDINLVKALKGLRTYAVASLIVNGNITDSRTGEVQFSDGALSGICIFDLSAKAADYIGKSEIALDIAPDYSEKALTDMIYNIKKIRSENLVEELLTGLMHKRIGQQILKKCGISLNAKCKELNGKQIAEICRNIKNMRFPVTAESNWELSQVTMGGIPIEEVDKNLMSAKANGIFLCGEILNICGDCGGFNLEWAWSSGYVAGKNAAMYLKMR